MTTFCLPHTPADLDALACLPRHWVDTADALASLIDEISACQVIALDTEFIKRTTYYPILALIQVNTGKAVYLIDAPKLDLQNFWQALTKVPTMVWYACGEDLGIFYLLNDCPPLTNVFDVQIGVAYLTGQLQMGYSHAVQEVLGVALDKGESQSDWLMRPLSDNQKRYADHDVRYLLALYESIKNALNAKSLLNFTIEDSQLYAKELYASANITDDELYLEFLVPNYTHEQVAVLQALIVWREKLARAKNKPRTFIVDKQSLREIIQSLPTTTKALSQTTLNRGSIRLYGQDIVNIIKRTLAMSKKDYPPLPNPVYTSKRKPFKKALEQAISEHSQRLGVPPNLLLKGRWVSELLYLVYRDTPTDALELSDGLMGYRYDWVVGTILPLLMEFKAEIQAGFDAPS